jgi:hypothetical protein
MNCKFHVAFLHTIWLGTTVVNLLALLLWVRWSRLSHGVRILLLDLVVGNLLWIRVLHTVIVTLCLLELSDVRLEVSVLTLTLLRILLNLVVAWHILTVFGWRFCTPSCHYLATGHFRGSFRRH